MSIKVGLIRHGRKLVRAGYGSKVNWDKVEIRGRLQKPHKPRVRKPVAGHLNSWILSKQENPEKRVEIWELLFLYLKGG